MKASYVTALRELLAETKPEQVKKLLAEFKRVLEERGHGKLYLPVLRQLIRELPHLAKGAVTVTVADPHAVSKYKKHIAADQAVLGTNDTDYEVSVDESLIGGYRLTVGDRRLDRSYKAALIRLYQNITT